MPPFTRRTAQPRTHRVQDYLSDVQRWTEQALGGAERSSEEQAAAAIMAQAAMANAVAALAVAVLEVAAAIKSPAPPSTP
jgi:hypothetical protein